MPADFFSTGEESVRVILRCEAAGAKKPEAYSLEYVEDFFESRTTQMPAARLPQQNGMTRTDS